MMNILRNSLVSILIILFVASSVQGQGVARVIGKVTEKGSNEPLIGANLIFQGTSIGSVTDLTGNFVINGAPVGTRILVISYIGYRMVEVELSLTSGQVFELNVQLEGIGIVGQDVVVTAQARGQLSAINQQLQSNTITNIVSAERIRELPDVNAAESIGRLPGVSIERSGGEANRISIRGLSPKYSTVSVNGVRVASTSDDRSVDLSLISSNMLDGVEVMKAITPDKDGDAVGGAVDLRLREAPSGLMVDLQAQGGYNQLQSYYQNYKLSGSLSSRFFKGEKLGLIATINLDEFDRSADKLNAGYQDRSDAITGERFLIPSSLNLREETVTRGRFGLSSLFDYRIPKGKITANMFYNRLSNDGLYRVNNLFNAIEARHHYDMNDVSNVTTILSSALGLEQDHGWLKYDVGVSISRSDVSDPNNVSWRFTQEGNAYRPFDRDPGMKLQDILPFITSDSSRTSFAQTFYSQTQRNENQETVQLNVQMPFNAFGWITGYVKTGGKLRWLDRENDESQQGRGGLHYGVTNNSPAAARFRCVNDLYPGYFNGYDLYATAVANNGLPIYVFNDEYVRPQFFNGNFPIGYTVDPQMARRLSAALNECGVFQEQVVASRGRDYHGTESYQAGYVMTEINLGKYLTFIPGVRFEGDKSKYTGQQFREIVINNQTGNPADLDTLVVSRRNEYWLPMVHLQIKPVSWFSLRLAYTETISRPDYIQYVPITRIDSQQQFAFAGNSKLRPSQSTNYDASVSIHSNKIGLFTFSAFSKEVTDHIIYQSLYTIGGVNPDPNLNVPPNWLLQNPRLDTYINNPFPANYKGFEVDWQTSFWYLPSVFKGLILNVNMTRIFSETKYQSFRLNTVCIRNCGTPRAINGFESVEVISKGRMVGQPSEIMNVTLGYDYKGFSTRFTYLYQSDRTNSVNGTTPIFSTYSGDYTRYDVSVKQKIVLGMEVFANFNNITNTTDRSYSSAPNSVNPTYIEYYGFTMDAGVRFRM